MRMSPRFAGDHPRFEEVAQLLQRVNQSVQVAANDLTVYLDSVDYKDCTGNRDSSWVTSFLWRRGDTVDRAPTVIPSLMSKANTLYVIWLSKSLLDFSNLHIMWVYAHEFRHFMQKRQFVDLLQLECFLMARHETVGIPDQPTQLEIPAELDSELFAKRVVTAILGEQAVSSHIAAECAKSEQAVRYFELFAQFERQIADSIAN